MDEIDRQQDAELLRNAIVDAQQSTAIEKLQRSSGFMMLMLIINTIAALAQIWESITVFMRLR